MTILSYFDDHKPTKVNKNIIFWSILSLTAKLNEPKTVSNTNKNIRKDHLPLLKKVLTMKANAMVAMMYNSRNTNSSVGWV